MTTCRPALCGEACWAMHAALELQYLAQPTRYALLLLPAGDEHSLHHSHQHAKHRHLRQMSKVADLGDTRDRAAAWRSLLHWQ